MSVVFRSGLSFGFLVPALLLALFGYAQFQDGWARDRSLPIPTYMLLERPAPKLAYVRAGEDLARTNRADGTNVIAQAEASLYGGAAWPSQVGLLEQGLRASPASARGWMLLAHITARTNPALASRAAAMGYLLGPMDYWVADIRVRQASLLWPILDGDTRASALAQARLLWQEPVLRWALLAQLSTPEGAQLMTKAFAGHNADLVALNRWVLKNALTNMPR